MALDLTASKDWGIYLEAKKWISRDGSFRKPFLDAVLDRASLTENR
jgi:hypothetical protein